MRKHLLQLLLIVGLTLFGTRLSAQIINDQLIVLNGDGLGYTAQQTIASDKDLIVLSLPEQRIVLNIQFNGPERLTFLQAHQESPQRLSLWSGSAFTRYRLSQTPSIIQADSGAYQLTVSPLNQVVSIENSEYLNSTLTWVLPSDFELLSFTASEESGQEANGRWSTSANTVSFASRGRPPASISINYRKQEALAEKPDPCLAVIAATDECSPDIDNDGIPDYRDICIVDEEFDSGDANSTLAQKNASLPDESSTMSATADDDVFGCGDPSLMVLEGVRFQSGQSYLDAKARQVLDRVAVALQHAPDRLFEVASHTDNAGRVAHNQRLSENRADAVRHYLMLRGVGPNQLQARGYGETSAVHDNRLAAGRRANRRVELRELN
ncbi:MAG: OmpA family protein [Granulosicoccus sp.]